MKSVTKFGMVMTAAVLLTLAGCGGGSSPAAPADTPATTSSVAVTTVLTTQ